MCTAHKRAGEKTERTKLYVVVGWVMYAAIDKEDRSGHVWVVSHTTRRLIYGTYYETILAVWGLAINMIHPNVVWAGKVQMQSGP